MSAPFPAAADTVHYEVETTTICQGWINCWMIDDEPQTFTTLHAALAELAEHCRDIDQAIHNGELTEESRPHAEDFRVVEVQKRVMIHEPTT